jgi:hypothetical protein
MVRSSEKAREKAAKPAENLIPVLPGARGATAASKAASTDQYWLDYYRTHDDRTKTRSASEALREKVALLNLNKKFRDVRAVLTGFLTYHPQQAEPWMYEALAIAIRMNGGAAADVQTALGYAADLAVKGRNPNDLVSVADQLLLTGLLPDRAGRLLDLSADLIPHRAEPLVMSINLAQRTKDPKRMGDAVERLLSLGWPGMDESMRRDARKQAETLSKTLREEGRAGDADALLSRLPDAEARDLFIRLTWAGDADLDLVIEEPLGATARYVTPRTVFGGSIVKNGYGSHPEDVYVCPRAFDGEYTVRIETVYNNPSKLALQATLEIITHEGTPQEHIEKRTITLGSKPPAPVKVAMTGGRRHQVLPFVAPTALLPEIIPGGARTPEKSKGNAPSRAGAEER